MGLAGAAGRILPSCADASLSPTASPPLASPLGPLRGRGCCQLCQYPHDATTVSAAHGRGARGTRLPPKAMLLGCPVTLLWFSIAGVGGWEGGELGSARLRRWVSGGGCRLGWLSLCPEQEGDFGLRWGLGWKIPQTRGFSACGHGRAQSTMSWRWDPLDAPHVETCVCSSGSPAGQAGGAGVLCGGLSPGSAAGPRRVSVPQAAGPCSQPCPEDGSIGWAGDRGALGRWSPVPWGQGGGQPGLLCQHSTADPLGTPSPRCRVLPFPSPSRPPLTAACPLQGDHQRGHGDRQG